MEGLCGECTHAARTLGSGASQGGWDDGGRQRGEFKEGEDVSRQGGRPL